MQLTSILAAALSLALAITTTAAPTDHTHTTTSTSPNPRSLPVAHPHHSNSHSNKRACVGTQYPELRTSSSTAPHQPVPYTISIDEQSQVEIGFTIPSDAVGPCSLTISLPADCQISGSRAGTQVNVYALDGPAAGALVGTTVFALGTKATINSFACREQMCYGLQVSGDGDGAGDVSFVEMEGVGLSMTYDC